jgi:hypothetical protein
MTLFRLVLCLLGLAAGGWWLEQERRGGRLQQIDELFLDFLTANARDRLTLPDPQVPDQVVFVPLREADRHEYAAWPPPPIDWQTLLKGLATHTPEVVVLTEPLHWGEPAPDFVPAVAEALLPFPSVVIGLPTAPTSPHALPLPAFGHVRGDRATVPAIGPPAMLPAPELRGLAELGLRPADAEPALPYVWRQGDRLVPSLLAQALARHTRSPFNSQSLRLGPGAGAHLNQGVHVPLTADGRFQVEVARAVPTVNALPLMTGAVADTLTEAERAALGQGRIVVIGLEGADGSSPARLHAQALQQILALPRLRQFTTTEQWLASGLAALIALGIAARTRRHRALRTGLGWIFLTLVTGFLGFQAALVWCPPTLPVFALATGSLIARVFGARAESTEPKAPSQAPETAASDKSDEAV